MAARAARSSDVLPSLFNIGGNLALQNTTLNLSNDLVLAGGSILSGNGIINGNVNNAGGFVTVGNSIGSMTINGNYVQGANAVIIVEVLNNGFNTVSDQLIVSGNMQVNGGDLVIGFVTSSLGLVTADFRPFVVSPGNFSGSFDTVVDAGGNILFIDISGGIFTILGANPVIPEDVLSDLIGFSEESEDLIEDVSDNRSEAEATLEELLEEEDEEEGSLICT